MDVTNLSAMMRDGAWSVTHVPIVASTQIALALAKIQDVTVPVPTAIQERKNSNARR